jgi:L-threonylcarbamoyladenylate synthase
MITRVLQVDPTQPDEAAIDEAAGVLERGGLVAFATETVYGLGAIATDPAAVAKIFHAKGRPSFNPVIVHVDSRITARACTATWPEVADQLAEAFWPGPLTLVLDRAPNIPDEVTAGGPTVGVRVPAHGVALALLKRLGKPIAAPSANQSNRISPTRCEHVLASLDGVIDLILDSGPTTVGLESTVLDLSVSPPRILRPGPIERRDLEAVLGRSIDWTEFPQGKPDRITSPGQLAVHYAPRTPAFRVERADELADFPSVATACIIHVGPQATLSAGLSAHHVALETPTETAHRLYEVLHQCDALGVPAIVVVMPPDGEEWYAIRDRLERATRPMPSRDEIAASG